MRVLQTIRHSEQAQAFQSQQEDLTNWIHEIVSAAWQFQVSVPVHTCTHLELLCYFLSTASKWHASEYYRCLSMGLLRRLIIDRPACSHDLPPCNHHL